MTNPVALTSLDLNYARNLLNTQGAAAAYEFLAVKGYNYAFFANGVVKNTTFEGEIANRFMEIKAAEQGITLSPTTINSIYHDMAAGYIDALGKQLETQIAVDREVFFSETQTFHAKVFKDYGLDISAWTLYEPFKNIPAAQQEAKFSDILNDVHSPLQEHADSLLVTAMFAKKDSDISALTWLKTVTLAAIDIAGDGLFKYQEIINGFGRATELTTIDATTGNQVTFKIDPNNQSVVVQQTNVSGQLIETTRTQFMDGKTITQRLNSNLQPTDTAMVVTVQNGDTFNSLAHYYGITPSELAIANPQITNINNILAGEPIHIPLAIDGDTVTINTYGSASGEIGMFNAFNLTTGEAIVQANPTNMLTVEQRLTESFNVGILTTSFYNSYTGWVSNQLVNPYGGFTVTPILDSINWGLSLDPIGAFYDSRSLDNDPALSIAARTPVLLDSNKTGLSAPALAARDTNQDGKLSGTELNGLNAWADLNENGLLDSGELSSATASGISEIRAADYAFYTQGNGNDANWRMAA